MPSARHRPSRSKVSVDFLHNFDHGAEHFEHAHKPPCGGLVRMLLPRTLCPAVCTRRSRPLEPWRLIPDAQILVLQPQPPCAVSFQHWHARLGRAGRLQSSTQEIRYPSSMEGHVPRLHCDHGQRHHAQRHSTARETALQRFLGRVVARRHLRRVSAARERNSSRPRVADA